MLNTIDLFVGCGGLSEGFEQSRKYKMIGAVEWEPSPVKELRNHLKNRWGIQDSEERVLQFDIQRTEELFNGWKDKKFGESKGLDALVGNRQLDVIIGGPPCQAYSVAGRIRDEHGMREDYRNYLFESYLKVVQHYKPRVFVFENVPGILSAKPGDGSVRIIDLIQKAFADAGYAVLPDLSNAIIDMTEYGVPQNRKRIIILGVSKEHYGDKAEAMVEKFYSSYLPEYKIEKKATVRDAIGDLPKLRPLDEPISYLGRKLSHSVSDPLINGHISRFHNKRDIELFKFLEEDIASGRMKYTSAKSLKTLYTKLTGKTSNVHKYYVLRWDEPTNLVLYQKYTYEDACRLLNWERNEVPLNIGGYKYDKKTKTFPIFINYDKQDNISDTTKYEDHFVAENRLIAISKSGRSMDSEDVQNFLNATERGIDVQLFVRKNKDDKISKEFYYLGRVIATGNAKQFVMPNTDKTAVEIEWELETPVREDIYQYIVNE